MLHVANGESLLARMKRTPLPGSAIPWREAMLAGPAPADLDDDEWVRVRSHHLHEAYGITLQNCEHSLRFQNDAIDAGLSEDELTLWFEEDLHCIVHLLYLLDRIANAPPAAAQLSIVRPGLLPELDPIYGLGDATGEQIMDLFDLREPITPQGIARGRSAWRAFTSADPLVIQRELELGNGEINGLVTAFEHHLSRFPETRTGLTRVHRAALEALANGALLFPELFTASKPGMHGIGPGDWQFWNELLGIVEVERPLMRIELESDGHPLLSGQWKGARFSITEDGASALRGHLDHVATNGIDMWLGGVHLEGREIAWRWDRDGQRIVADQAERLRL